MTRWTLKLAAAAMVVAGSAASLGVPAVPARAFFQSGGGTACTYYEHANFEGASGIARNGQDSPFVGQFWNDKISAISCRQGCAVLAFEHANFQGARRLYYGSTSFVGAAWNDRISSFVATCS